MYPSTYPRNNEIESVLSKNVEITRERKIISNIKNNPGIRFRELMRIMKISNGVMSYYIQKLEKNKTIFSDRKSGVSRLFTNDIKTAEISLIKFLRTPTPKKIMLCLLEYENLSFKQITEKIQMSPSTTSFYLKKLLNTDIVFISSVNHKKYSLNYKKEISNLITLYHPDIVDSASENLADIFSSF